MEDRDPFGGPAPLWPDSPKSLFRMEGSNPLSPTTCRVERVSDIIALDGWYLSQQFKRAADLVVEHLSTGLASGRADGLFVPVAYLYRHSLELELKFLVSLSAEGRVLEPSASLIGALGRHSLQPLWSLARVAIESRWPAGNPAELDHVEELILDFHRVDESGQNLRYSHDRAGRPAGRGYPGVIDLSELRDAFEAVHNLLEGCATEFIEIVRRRPEKG